MPVLNEQSSNEKTDLPIPIYMLVHQHTTMNAKDMNVLFAMGKASFFSTGWQSLLEFYGRIDVVHTACFIYR